jgi:hypothetical protein
MPNLSAKIQALQKASQEKHNNALLKVNKVLLVMEEKNIPTNFSSLAKLSGVSKSWLYSQLELKNQIETMRVQKGKIRRVIDLQAILEKKETEVQSLKEKNRELNETIKKLRRQLETIYGELYKMRKE